MEIDFYFLAFPNDSTLGPPVFSLFLMLNICFSCFLACRSFAFVTITHSHQTVPTSSSSSSSPLSLKFSCLQNPFPPTYMPIFCMSHYNYMHAKQLFICTEPMLENKYTASLSFRVPFQMQHNFFLWIKCFHQTIDHFYILFLSLALESPSFVISISSAFLSFQTP